MQSIACTISVELRAKLQSAEFWGLLFDGSEDITKTEQEIVYIVSVSSNGEFSSDFIGLIELGADRTAQAITNGLARLFQDTGLDDWTTKLVAVCTDGAAVNVGIYNGVVPKLRQLVAIGDSLVHILCTAHTLENCAKTADRNVPYCETFNRSVIKLLQFYLQKGGAKKTAALKNLCEENGISFVKLERFQCFLLHMLDIGNILKTTSIRFQKEKLTIGECKDELMVAIGQFTLLLDVFDPSTWPQEMRDLHNFGNTTVCSILKKYDAILQLDKDTTVTEWMRLKQAGKRLKASSVYDLVQIVNTSNPDAYSNINKVVKLSLTLPLSSAACERGFSHLNIIKTKYRSRLSPARLSALMHIHLSKLTTETFDPKPAVDLWMETANRRLNQGQAGASAASSSSTMQETEAEDSGNDNEEDSGGDTEEDRPSVVSMRSDWSMGEPPMFRSAPPQSDTKQQTQIPASPGPSVVSMRSDWSMGEPPMFRSAPPQSDTKQQTQIPASPGPSVVSMRSDWSMGEPPMFRSAPPQSDTKQQTQIPASPGPSVVSMRSDWSMGEPPMFRSAPPQSDTKQETQFPASPGPSVVSMRSDWSMGEPPMFRSAPPQSDTKQQTQIPASPGPSVVSMRSDWSMGEPPMFRSAPPQSDTKQQTQIPASPGPSVVSMRSDWSMGEPPMFRSAPQSDTKQETQFPASPGPSVVSMRSDWSMGEPPMFRSAPPQSDTKQQTQIPASPGPSVVSMRSDWSMGEPPMFRSAPQSDTKQQTQIPASPGPSVVSMRSDWSMGEPPMFRSAPPQSDTKTPGRIAGLTELMGIQIKKSKSKSDWSMGEPPMFSSAPPQSDTKLGVSRHGNQFGDDNSSQCRKRLSTQSLVSAPIKRIKQSGVGVLNSAQISHKSKMKKKFGSICEGIIRSSGIQTPLNKIYTDLYITEGESEVVNSEHEVCQVESASRTQTSEDTPINCNDIFKPLHGQQRRIRIVMTKGIAGIGKTVSVQKFILDWAEEKTNQEVDFMFVLPFRELNVIKTQQVHTSLHSLLLDFHPELEELLTDEFKDCHIVFIFDGLDESRLQLNFLENQLVSEVTQTSSVDVLITSLIQGNLLPSALIWITSRPAAASQIPSQCISQVTEVRGFNDPQQEEYFRKRISDQNLAIRIISHIKSSKSLYIMCHMPVFCWIMAIVLQQILEQDHKEEVPKTLTEMFIHFLLIQTTRKNQKYQAECEPDRQKLLESHKDVILKLAELAFKHLENGNLMFYEEDMSECGIDVTEASVYSGMCTEIFREESVFHHTKVYCFVHLSVQEFLAALFVWHSFMSLNMEALKSFLSKKQREKKAFLPLHILLKSALDKALESKNGHLDLFLRFLLGISVESNQFLLQGLLTNTLSSSERSESIKKTCQYIKLLKRKDLSPERCINLLHCLFEMKDLSRHEEVQKYLISPDGVTGELSPMECTALAHMIMMSDKALDTFEPKKYKTSEEGRRRLLPVVRCCRTAVLAGCDLTVKSYEIVASALQSANSPLTELDLSQNDLHMSGEKLVSGLQSPNCKLEKLRLVDCKLSGRLLASALQGNNSHLRELDISKSELQDCGEELLYQPLNQDCKVRLFSLQLMRRSCEVVASVLQSCISQLCELDLTGCDLKTSEEKLVCSFTKPNCQLEKLRLVGCGATDKSGEILAFALQSAESHFTELDLSNITLGDCGGKLCLKDLNPDCKMEKLSLADCKMTEISCEVVASAVQYMKSLRVLDLSNNHMNSTGIQSLNAGINRPGSALEILRLVDCGLTEKSGDILEVALQSVNSFIRELDLSENILGDCGALNPHCKLEILRLAGCKLTEKTCEVVASAMQYMVFLRVLDLSDNHMNITGTKFLTAWMSQPTCALQKLRLAGCNLTEKPCKILASAVKSLIEMDLSDNYFSIAGIQLLNKTISDSKWKLQNLRYCHGEDGRIKPNLRKYVCDLTFDSDTAFRRLSLSESNRKVTRVGDEQPYPDIHERFDYWDQVLCREGLSGHSYWEAEWSGNGAVIAVACKSMKRKGNIADSMFGCNNQSWCLTYKDEKYIAWHNNNDTPISAPSPHSSRVGVYLDWQAGTLSFYSVSSDKLTHLHTFHSKFTEPLYPGFRIWDYNSTVFLCPIS
ncbi:uncharacterized protein LOC134078010 [Sardina pilchardus]|uniref:uncharacterized protein LOC134078010 n=1 Tax=Sardina pilchardus TaxID=27697 RepID=UPI002E145B3D